MSIHVYFKLNGHTRQYYFTASCWKWEFTLDVKNKVWSIIKEKFDIKEITDFSGYVKDQSLLFEILKPEDEAHFLLWSSNGIYI